MTEQAQVPDAEFQSYYGRPILKLPRWKEPHLPLYLFLGGLSGASAVMGAAAAVTGRRGLARAGRVTAAAAAMGGTGFLIAELGRPERFLHMLRVAKLTSPMSMGSWLLAAHASLAGAAAASDVTGVAPRLGATAGAASALTGPLLATYTGVLLADTAVPAWHEGQRRAAGQGRGGAHDRRRPRQPAEVQVGGQVRFLPAGQLQDGLAVVGPELRLRDLRLLGHREPRRPVNATATPAVSSAAAMPARRHIAGRSRVVTTGSGGRP